MAVIICVNTEDVFRHVQTAVIIIFLVTNVHLPSAPVLVFYMMPQKVKVEIRSLVCFSYFGLFFNQILPDFNYVHV